VTQRDVRYAKSWSFESRVSNDDVTLSPATIGSGPTVPFDFPGLSVGIAEYAEGPTGCTVIYLPAGARTAIDVRGGAVGITGAMRFNHAICFAGGSLNGLEASAGVTAALLAKRGNRVDWDELECVSGAIIYDYSARDNAIYPDLALGKAALEALSASEIPVGRRGAGASATVGKMLPSRAEFAGQGAAFVDRAGLKVVVVTVVNAVGVVVDRTGAVVRGNVDPSTGEREGYADYYRALESESYAPAAGNTTITAVITNAKVSDLELEQLGRMVHSSMHRAIQPFHTMTDGDVLFTLTTDEHELDMTVAQLGVLGSEAAWDAVLASLT
jgi:6-aminohexanoate-oligomer endohydrolase